MSGVNHEYMESDYVYIRDSSRADDNCKMRYINYRTLEPMATTTCTIMLLIKQKGWK